MRKCYEVEVEYLMKAVMKSKSPCLKINTVKGIITWKSEIKEVRLDFWKNGEECMEKSIRNQRRYVEEAEKMGLSPDLVEKYVFIKSNDPSFDLANLAGDADLSDSE